MTMRSQQGEEDMPTPALVHGPNADRRDSHWFCQEKGIFTGGPASLRELCAWNQAPQDWLPCEKG